jgi:hypothetical protein
VATKASVRVVVVVIMLLFHLTVSMVGLGQRVGSRW